MHFETYVEKITLFQKNYLNNSTTILDLGCGPGNNAKLLTEKNNNYQIKGVDLSTKMIELARQNVPEGDFYVSDIREYNDNSTYDVVIASFCIVHLQTTDTIELVKHISRLMNNGSYLYLSFMTGKRPGFEKTSFSQDDIYFNYYNVGEIIRCLVKNQLKVLERHEEDYQEKDGTITKDIFLFVQKEENQQR